MGLIVIIGLCLIFTPIVVLFAYLITRVRKENEFDKRIKYLKAKKGMFWVLIAYLEKILLGLAIMLLGFFMSEELENELALELLIVCAVLYVIVRYFNKKSKR